MWITFLGKHIKLLVEIVLALIPIRICNYQNHILITRIIARRETCSERETGTGRLCEIKWDCHIVCTRAQ
jgi:hypothetical protein